MLVLADLRFAGRIGLVNIFFLESQRVPFEGSLRIGFYLLLKSLSLPSNTNRTPAHDISEGSTFIS